MKKIFFIDDSISNRISFWHLVCFGWMLPLPFVYSQLVLASFTIHTLIHLTKDRFNFIFSRPVFLVSAIYLLGIIGFFYSPDKSEAFNVAGRQSAILWLPAVLAVNELDFSKYKIQLLKLFGLGITATVLYLYAHAVYSILYFKQPLSVLFSTSFTNHNFSLPLELHATYLSMYVALSITSFLFLILQPGSRRNKLIYLFCIMVLSAGLLQLSSRSVFIALLVIVNLGFPFLLLSGKKRLQFMLAAVTISAAVLIFIFSINSFKLRYVADLKLDLTQSSINNEIMEPRIVRWDAAMELVKQSPLIGHGSGSEKELLKEKYFEKKLYISYLNEFNAHNEYLSFLLKTGIAGLLVYLYVLFSGFSIAVKKRDILFFAFMLLICIVSFSENILDVNKGVFFYSFFFSLFLLSHRQTGAAGSLKK
ncbi:MAG: O-antigen ligase family protein [Ferruginibacter sp.]